MTIDLPYKLVGLLIVISGWIGGCIWGLSKIHSNFKSLEEEFDEYKESHKKEFGEYKESQKETFLEYKKSQKETFLEYKKLMEKQLSDKDKEIEIMGKDLHRYNKNTQTVINNMRLEEIIPATHDIKALFKSDKESKKDIAEINNSIKKVSDLVHGMDTKIELLIQSNG